MPELLPAWPGATVAIAASGPTLTAEQLALIRGTRVPLLVVNDAVRLAPWADVLYSSDRRWWAVHGVTPPVQAFSGVKIGIGTKKGDASPVPGPAGKGVHVLMHTGEEGLEAAPTGLRSGRHSGYAAINLAVHLGAVRILLLGYSLGPVGNETHFFGRHPKTLPETTDAGYQRFRAAYETLAPALEARGIFVLNCTPWTKLKTFPRVELAMALAIAVEAGVPC